MLFQKTWGGSGPERGTGIAVDSDRNLIVTGATSSFGAAEVPILKYDPSGNLTWQRAIGGSNPDAAKAVGVDSGGNIYVVGDTGRFGPTAVDVFLFKLSPSGNLLWEKMWGGSEIDQAHGLAVDSAGNAYVVGNTDSAGAGLYDIFLLKFDSSGILQWQRTWGGLANDFGQAVALGPSGSICLAGLTNTLGTAGDVLLMKLNSAGAVAWQETFGGARVDDPADLAVDASGNVYVAGSTNSVGTGTTQDAFLVKTDSLGRLLWQKSWGTWGAEDTASALALDTDGNAYMLGTTYAYTAGETDAFLLKMDPNDGLAWQKTWGGSGWDAGGDVAIDFVGDAIVTGAVGTAPPYTLGNPPIFLGDPAFGSAPSDLTGTTSSLSTQALTWTIQTPAGSETYAGSGEVFLFKYRAGPPIPIEVVAVVRAASAPDDLDYFLVGAGECYFLSTVTGADGSVSRRWPQSGSEPCGDGAFTVWPNFNIYGPDPPHSGIGGVSFHIEAWEQDDFLTFGDDTFGRVDFTISEGELLSLMFRETNPCKDRTDTTTGGELPMSIATRICVYDQPRATSGCTTTDTVPPLVQSWYTPVAPDAGSYFNVTATATDRSGCGVLFIRIYALGPGLALSPQVTTCRNVEFPPPYSTFSCTGRFGPVLDWDGNAARYVVLQIRGGDGNDQNTYEPPVLFETGHPRSHNDWAAPTLIWGTKAQLQDARLLGTSDRHDVVFFADPDYDDAFGASARTTFLGDIANFLFQGLFSQNTLVGQGSPPLFVGREGNVTYFVQESNIYHFNVWYVWDYHIFTRTRPNTYRDRQDAGGNWLASQPSIPGCGFDLLDPNVIKPCNWGFADSKGVLHNESLRDASWRWGGILGLFAQCGCFTATRGSGLPALAMHEMGHNLYGLADEYCCDGGYGADAPYKNVWGSMEECQTEAAVSTPVTWSGSNCTAITSGSNFADCSGGIGLMRPCVRADPAPDMMTCMGCPWPGAQYQASDTNRIVYVDRGLGLPQPGPSFTPITGAVAWNGLSAQSGMGAEDVCVSDPDGNMCFSRNLLTPATPSKIVVIMVAFTEAGTSRVLGAYVTDGKAPDRETIPKGHPTINTSTGYGEPLDYFGLDNALADAYAQRPRNLTVPIILDFRRQMQDVVLQDSNETVWLRYDVSSAINAYCVNATNDPDCQEPPGPVPDNVLPTWPSGSALTASEVGTATVTLGWTAATDNVGVVGYRILQSGVVIANLTAAERTYHVEGLVPGTLYEFQVVAVDAAGNVAPGPRAAVTTATSAGNEPFSWLSGFGILAWVVPAALIVLVTLALLLRRRRRARERVGPPPAPP